MAEQADALEREDELNQDQGPGAGDGDQGHEDQSGGEVLHDQDDSRGEGGDAGDQEEFEISFGDEAAPASRGNDSDLVKHLRQVNREQAERLAKFERGEISVQPQTIEVGPKPTLESCDYDEAKFETELDTWKERKRQADEAQTQAQSQARAVQEKFQTRLQAYGVAKQALRAKDFEIAEAAVTTVLSPTQQAIAIQAADDSAKLVYALGRHPEKLKALGAIQDPIEFTKALVKLEGQLKVTSRSRTTPEPDRPVRGAAPLTNGTDKALERLESEAARTGDRSKVIAYKREQRRRAEGRS